MTANQTQTIYMRQQPLSRSLCIHVSATKTWTPQQPNTSDNDTILNFNSYLTNTLIHSAPQFSHNLILGRSQNQQSAPQQSPVTRLFFFSNICTWHLTHIIAQCPGLSTYIFISYYSTSRSTSIIYLF